VAGNEEEQEEVFFRQKLFLRAQDCKPEKEFKGEENWITMMPAV